MHLKGKVLVFIQFACLCYYPISGNLISSNLGLAMLELLGLMVGISGILSMKLSRLSVFPEPKKASELVEQGIYKYIRHPMYAGILMVAFSLTINQLSWHSVAVLSILTLNQLIKLSYEERLLKKKFAEYDEYMTRTKRLIPFIFAMLLLIDLGVS